MGYILTKQEQAEQFAIVAETLTEFGFIIENPIHSFHDTKFVLSTKRSFIRFIFTFNLEKYTIEHMSDRIIKCAVSLDDPYCLEKLKTYIDKNDWHDITIGER